MTKELKEYLGIRNATEEEVATYYKVESLITDEIFDDALEIASLIPCINYCEDKKEEKRNYNRAYRLAKKLGITVNDLVTWYCTEEV